MKIANMYRKKYTEKKLESKILRKIFLAADKSLVESYIVKSDEPVKGKILHSFNIPADTDKKTVKRLNAIAKEIKKQKGRFKIVSIFVALAIVAAIVLALTTFRNVIARTALTYALEGSFGARCEMKSVDVNLLDSRFRIDGLSVANREKVMKNLFEIGCFEMYFDLLELTRGKVVAENLEITGVTWNTDRTTSGELPPKQKKAFEERQKKKEGEKPNPVVAAITGEVEKIKSGVSLDSGIEALKDQFDPEAFIAKERAALKSPAVVEKITATVPAMAEKWEKKTSDVRKQVDSTIIEVKRISEIDLNKIKDVEDARKLLKQIESASDSLKAGIATAKETAGEVNTDLASAKALAAEAESALKSDAERFKQLANSIKSFNLDSGKKMISGAFNTFIVNTLGEYYPYLDKGMTAFREMQSGQKKEKKQTLKSKSNTISRLPGRNFVYGADTLPSLVLRNVALSAQDGATGIAGSAAIRNVTNDADKLDKPMTASLGVTHGDMTEKVTGTFDMRTAAPTPVDAGFNASGYPLAISSGGATGVPSIKGTIEADGNLSVVSDGAVHIVSDLVVSRATMAVEPFKPDFLYETYRDVLATVNRIDLEVKVDVSPSGTFAVDLSTELDKVLYEALQKKIYQKIEEVKAGIRREAEAYIAEQRAKYTSEIGRFTAIADKSTKLLAEIKNYEGTIDEKKAEAEKRIKAIVAEQVAEKAEPAKKAAKEAVDKAVGDIDVKKKLKKTKLP